MIHIDNTMINPHYLQYARVQCWAERIYNSGWFDLDENPDPDLSRVTRWRLMVIVQGDHNIKHLYFPASSKGEAMEKFDMLFARSGEHA